MALLDDVRIIELPNVIDPRGNLSFGEVGMHIPFEVKRIFYVYDIPEGAKRGGHAHKTNDELVMAVRGVVTFTLWDGKEEKKIILDTPYKALFVPRDVWVDIDFSGDALVLALASTHYNDADYIRSREEYLRYVKYKR